MSTRTLVHVIMPVNGKVTLISILVYKRDLYKTDRYDTTSSSTAAQEQYMRQIAVVVQYILVISYLYVYGEQLVVVLQQTDPSVPPTRTPVQKTAWQ